MPTAPLQRTVTAPMPHCHQSTAILAQYSTIELGRGEEEQLPEKVKMTGCLSKKAASLQKKKAASLAVEKG